MSPTTPDPPQNHALDPPAAGDPTPTPVIDIVACDGVDTSPLVVAAHGLAAEVRVFNSPESWFEHLAELAREGGRTPADVAAMVGRGERLQAQRWVARARAAAVGTNLLAAVVDGSLDQAMSVVNQGAGGLIVMPLAAERLADRLREIVEPAARLQPRRREAAQHRRALHTLTNGENEVLEGMLTGLANKQIAQRLGIGLRTVELRRSKIMKKLSAKSLPQLVRYVCSAREGCG